MLRSAPPPALGSALRAARAQAPWCAADPGSIRGQLRIGSRLRGASQRNAAPRPGQEAGL